LKDPLRRRRARCQRQLITVVDLNAGDVESVFDIFRFNAELIAAMIESSGDREPME
jgi:hypothetical protein